MLIKTSLSDNESPVGYGTSVDLQKVTIEKLVSGGLGLARDAAGVVFVEGVLPGETVVLEDQFKIQGTRRARPREWITTSPQRRTPPCPIHETCGGCGFQIADEETQLRLKADWFRESLRRLGRWEIEDLDLVQHSTWSYRHRAQIHFDGTQSGFFSERSHHLVRVENCPVLAAPLQALFRSDHPFWQGRPPGRYTVCTNPSEVFTETDPRARVRLNGLWLEYHPAGFMQAHLELTEKLRAWIDQTLGPEPASLWDLYGGVGTWSQLPERRGWQLTIVESDRRLESFVLVNCPKAAYSPEKVEDFLARQSTAPTVVLVDPPRSGLSARALTELIRLRPNRLIYIGCDGDTFARDARGLRTAGWEASYLGLWDFYPQTPHLEVVSVWQPT